MASKLDYSKDSRVRKTATGYLLPVNDPRYSDWEVVADRQRGGWHARPVDRDQTGVWADTAEEAVEMVIGPPA